MESIDVDQLFNGVAQKSAITMGFALIMLLRTVCEISSTHHNVYEGFSMSHTKDTEERNRFTELLEQLEEKSESEKSLSGYKSLLDNLDEDDTERPATIPFPYGGSSDFAKWVTEPHSRSGWRSTAAPF